jgi:hypothetical protein
MTSCLRCERPFLLTCLAVMLTACSSSPAKPLADGGGSKEGGASSDGACQSPDGGDKGDPQILVGTFQVRLVAPVPATSTTPETAGYTSVVGKVYDGPTPSQTLWEEAAKEGSCQLLKPRIPFCSPSCTGGAVCVENDQCQAYPTAISVGTVQVTGLHPPSGTAAFSMTPVASSYQPPSGVSLPYPAFSEGETIRFEASGSCAVARFALEASGVAPLEIKNETITLESGKAITLSWSAPSKSGLFKIHVKLDISHHGGTKGMIACDVEDTGSLELSAVFITQLLNLGVAGFPSIIVTRSSTGSATIASGRVDLVVSSEVEKEVKIPGVTSCNKDTDCPDGHTCQKDLTCTP